jgi:hypothetical protein
VGNAVGENNELKVNNLKRIFFFLNGGAPASASK